MSHPFHQELAETYRWQWDGYHLRVERRDGADGIPWDDLQKIKNIACGPEMLLVEFYPPQEQMIDEVNARHLWAIGGEIEGFGTYRPAMHESMNLVRL